MLIYILISVYILTFVCKFCINYKSRTMHTFRGNVDSKNIPHGRILYIRGENPSPYSSQQKSYTHCKKSIFSINFFLWFEGPQLRLLFLPHD